jgi:hypothetical protein
LRPESTEQGSHNLIADEISHQRSSESCDPGFRRSLYMTDNNLLAMNTKFPLLMDFSDMFIKNIPPANLLKMGTTTFKMREKP